MGHLGADQAGQQGIEVLAPRGSLADHLVEAGAHAVELQVGHRLDDLVSFHHVACILVVRRASYRAQSAIGSALSLSASGVVMLGAGGG